MKSDKYTDIEAIVFDFGGTLDTNGEHWSEVFQRGYIRAGLEVPEGSFRDAWAFAERTLGEPGRVIPTSTFQDVILLKTQLQLGYLAHNKQIEWEDAERCVSLVAGYCVQTAETSTAASRTLLHALSPRFALGIASNFYGNLPTVLHDNGLRPYFRTIADSALLGVRKPDPGLLEITLKGLGVKAEKTVVVGDSLKNDILPALALGCKAIWLAPQTKSDVPEGADRILKLTELPEILGV